jgi:cytidylate kinase
MTTGGSLDQVNDFIEAQMYEWRQRRGQSQPVPRPTITITRQPGSGAEAIAKKLATALNMRFYSWEIVEEIAKSAHVSTKVVATLDEKSHSELQDWLADFGQDEELSTYKYLTTLKKVLFTIAVHGNAVIFGRGGNFLLPPERRIGLYLVSPLDIRIRNVMNERGLSSEDALEYIARIESQQRRFVKKHAGKDVRDLTNYHLVINTSLVKPEAVIRAIQGMIEASS